MNTFENVNHDRFRVSQTNNCIEFFYTLKKKLQVFIMTKLFQGSHCFKLVFKQMRDVKMKAAYFA